MIDPNQITKYDRNESELEEFLMFAIMVAGKSAQQTAIKLKDFLRHSYMESPIEYVDRLVQEGSLDYTMKSARIGQYNRIGNAFKGIIQFKNRLREVSVSDLESVSGIGSKTARFFVLHSRPNQQIAVLDTHILKWLKLHGEKAPKTTPPKKQYATLEKAFLKYSKDYDLPPAELDLHIWKQYSEKCS